VRFFFEAGVHRPKNRYCGRAIRKGTCTGYKPVLREAVAAGGEEAEEAEVAQELKLLADFGAECGGW